MTYAITIQHSDQSGSTQFTCNSDQAILDAALAAGLVLPYGCKNGACGSCKAPMLDGSVTHRLDNMTVKQAVSESAALLCCAMPCSDATFTTRVAKVDKDYPIKKLPVRVAAIESVSDDVKVLRLQLPAAEKLAFRAGQYLEFILRDGSKRAYSMANAPHTAANNQQLELHIRHLKGGLFTDALFAVTDSKLNPIKEKDIMRIEVPQGMFYLREDSNKPIIMVASGTGFAPIKAMIEHALHHNVNRPIVLYWGGRAAMDLYFHSLAQSWADAHQHIQYIPVVSDNTAQWQGRIGFVHRAVMEDFPDLSAHEVYACGAPVMVNSAKSDFVNHCGLPEDAFFADSFTSAADLA